MQMIPRKLWSRLLVLVGLSIIPAIMLIIYTGLEQREILLANAEHNAMHLAEVTANGLEQITLRTKVMLSLLAQMPEIRQMDKCNSLFASLRNHGNSYANIGLIKPNGSVACSALPYSSKVKLDDRAYFKRSIESHGFSVGNFQIGRITHKESINFAYPVFGDRKQLDGVLFAALPLQWIYDHLFKSDLPDGGTVSVIDSSRKLLVRIPEVEGQNGKSLAGDPLLDAVRESGDKGIVVMKDKQGVKRAFVFTTISGMPKGQEIYISIGLPISFIYAKADRITIRNLVILIFAAGFVFLIAWKGGDVFVLRPIRLLLATTRELTTGKLNVRAPIISHGGELAELASSFNHMAETLEVRTHGINRLNRIYAVLSNINGTILRVRNRQELLQETCRIAVEHGQFKLAWIGLVDDEEKFLRPAAYMGEHEELVRDQAVPLWNSKMDGIQLAGKAVVEQEDIIVNDIEADDTLTEWKKRTGVDFYSMAIFPLKVEGKIIGTFSLYTGEPSFFDKQELRLLRELASDASLGLEIIGKEDQLYDLAHFDALTGLPNRHEFEDRIRLSIAQAANQEKTVAVLVIGIDHLQRIRDELGHRTGDEALRIVSEHLKAFTGNEDEVARIGSNEFGLIFPEIDTSLQAASLVEGILNEFPHVLDFEGNEFSLNIHIGATLYPQDGEDAEELAKNAELAMHHAPLATTERPLAFFSMDMEEQVRQQRWMEQQLRHAIEKNEFELYFQPVIDIRNRTMMGCESLLRWHSNALGEVSPADFIPIAEQNGLIMSIGEWVMTHAFQQAADWKRLDLPSIRIVVNVSLKQLSQSDFVERVRDIRQSVASEETELMLGIEITESQLMDNIEQVLEKLEQLKAMGFTIYIDDFGTGYSSLSYLRQLPVDILKIDISFIHDIEHNPDAVAMAKGIIALAHSLDLRVIAEGVETSGQLSILEQLKCDYAQGYLFSRPVPAAQIEDMIGKHI